MTTRPTRCCARPSSASFSSSVKLGRLRQIDPGTAARIADLPRAVGLRNILAHAYSVVDDSVIWGLLSGPLDRLIAQMEAI